MHPIENILKTSMDEIKEMVDVNTIVGEAVVTPDGSTVIPISRVGFGFLSGGGEYGEADSSSKNESTSFPFAGGSSAAISLNPIAFLVLKGDNWKMLSVDHKNTYEKIIDIVPQVINEIKNAFTSGKNNNETPSNS